MQIPPEIQSRLEKLTEKYKAMGQDMVSYLDGLLYADYLTYWDYIHLDVLLNLQTPKTPFPDENIFITYHQITELYFKLCLKEINQIADASPITLDFLKNRLFRLNKYFDQLVRSFTVMIDVMDKDEFLKFRMSLLPASGFQSAQYRMIEICSADIQNLVHINSRNQLKKSDDLVEVYQHLYWKQGATELASGKKTLTLRQFEEKYSDKFIHLIRDFYHKNIWQKYLQLSKEDQKDDELIKLMREYDVFVNVRWPLSHYKSAVKHLHKDPSDIAATGGTNWQQYLPPKKQLITFYPELWTEEERNDWGKRVDMRQFFGI